MLIEPREADEARRATADLSIGLEALVAQHAAMDDAWRADASPPDFDVVIVGSGYGGAIAAAALAGSTDGQAVQRVCVLERGREYLGGSFPTRLAELAGQVRLRTPAATGPMGARDALFDVRVGTELSAIVANGVGGGSLINAGVMEMPHASVFREAAWPGDIRRGSARLLRTGRALLGRLGAARNDQPHAKTLALASLAASTGSPRSDFKRLPITVAQHTAPNVAGDPLQACIGCGDCFTGCNHDAKDSLDRNLLRIARQAGACIVTGALVLRVERCNGAWDVIVNHTDLPLRKRQARPYRLRAKRVVLAAGTFGSTEILMRSRQAGLRVSDRLGQRFSGNGDMIATVHDLDVPVNAVANEAVAPRARTEPGGQPIGPTITAMLDCRSGNPATDVVIQDLAVPAGLRRLYEEAVTTAGTLHRIASGDRRVHDEKGDRPDDAAVNPQAMGRSLVVAMIGRDGADGELRWGAAAPADHDDGVLTVSWPALGSEPRFADHHAMLLRLIEARNKMAPGRSSRLIDNPMWRPLPKQLEDVFGEQRGPLLTVHPLGGCAMGENVRSGVTDHLGRIFDAAAPGATQTHPGLVVLDGSIVPTSLGINPALTIAALARRSIVALMKDWKLRPRRRQRLPTGRVRPRFRQPPGAADVAATEIEVCEQMRGTVPLRTRDGGVQAYEVELTLTTEPTALGALMAHQAPLPGRVLQISPAQSRLRVLELRPPDSRAGAHGAAPDERVVFSAAVGGTMQLFALQASTARQRTCAALVAWFHNRGLRDIAQSMLGACLRWLEMLPPDERPHRSLRAKLLAYAGAMRHVASYAGGVRLLGYELQIVGPPGAATPSPASAATFDVSSLIGQPIKGSKHLTYERGASPWTQLMEMELQQFPGLAAPRHALPHLQLDPRYLARKQVPLLRIVRQQDRVAALADLASFVLFVARIVLQTHGLSLRQPDLPSTRAPVRLPGSVPGLAPPQISWLSVAAGSHARPAARIRLARYQPAAQAQAHAGAGDPPVLLIHGYSASGTTYAHPQLPQGLAKTLCDAGRDVWVLDMRSSAGMPTAREDWAFEDMAGEDIPIAVDHLRAATASAQVDVVAHCMGSAMFAMGVLADEDRHGAPNALHQKIGRLVMSQIGPAMVLSPANVLRAYVMRFVRDFLPLQDYQFSPAGGPALAGLLDRVLATLPTPPDEFARENPRWPPGKFTPWVGTRHRIDALYARTFTLANLSDAVLDHIDDFFGPLSIETVSQVIHFARFGTVTDRTGVNNYATRSRMRCKLTFPMLSLHGADNGLADVATLAQMRKALGRAGIECFDEVTSPLDPARATLDHTTILALINAQRGAWTAGASRASYMSWRIGGHGHQDCLIGRHTGSIGAVITAFLARGPVQAVGAGDV